MLTVSFTDVIILLWPTYFAFHPRPRHWHCPGWHCPGWHCHGAATGTVTDVTDTVWDWLTVSVSVSLTLCLTVTCGCVYLSLTSDNQMSLDWHMSEVWTEVKFVDSVSDSRVSGSAIHYRAQASRHGCWTFRDNVVKGPVTSHLASGHANGCFGTSQFGTWLFRDIAGSGHGCFTCYFNNSNYLTIAR